MHYHDGNVMQGSIVKKTCNVKLYRFIPNNLEEYPFVALVCVSNKGILQI